MGGFDIENLRVVTDGASYTVAVEDTEIFFA
jgi:hypothetical protein